MHHVPLAMLLALLLGLAACGEDAGTAADADADGALRLDDASMQRFVDLAEALRDLGAGGFGRGDRRSPLAGAARSACDEQSARQRGTQ